MPRHLLDEKRDQLHVPVLVRDYNLKHPDRLTASTLLIAQQAPTIRRIDTAALPAIVARAAAPLRPVTA